VVGRTETISEQHLISVRGDPASVSLSHPRVPLRQPVGVSESAVVELLNKVLVEEFTKSRAYRTADNALVEGKSGAVIREQIGYGPMAASILRRRSSTRRT
jgi:hypothetical protein